MIFLQHIAVWIAPSRNPDSAEKNLNKPSLVEFEHSQLWYYGQNKRRHQARSAQDVHRRRRRLRRSQADNRRGVPFREYREAHRYLGAGEQIDKIVVMIRLPDRGRRYQQKESRILRSSLLELIKARKEEFKDHRSVGLVVVDNKIDRRRLAPPCEARRVRACSSSASLRLSLRHLVVHFCAGK